jgi:hypothetical protein
MLHPIGRMGEVEEIVDAVLYLDGAAFVTGEVLHVDGGSGACRLSQPEIGAKCCHLRLLNSKITSNSIVGHAEIDKVSQCARANGPLAAAAYGGP